MTRLQWLFGLLGLLGLWLIGDELQRSRASDMAQHQKLAREQLRLAQLPSAESLQALLNNAATSSAGLRRSAYAGPSLGKARAALAADLQSMLADPALGAALFRFTGGAVATADAAARTRGAEAGLPVGFTPEAFSVSGTFAPDSLLALLNRLAKSNKLLAIEGLSIKGSRFELFGTAVLHADPGLSPK